MLLLGHLSTFDTHCIFRIRLYNFKFIYAFFAKYCRFCFQEPTLCLFNFSIFVFTAPINFEGNTTGAFSVLFLPKLPAVRAVSVLNRFRYSVSCKIGIYSAALRFISILFCLSHFVHVCFISTYHLIKGANLDFIFKCFACFLSAVSFLVTLVGDIFTCKRILFTIRSIVLGTLLFHHSFGHDTVVSTTAIFWHS